ncbi:MAG: class I SAM-dependent methyltransferase [Parcubacteria group bacterium]|nr:class I SAM-dependent methyltransferase [Parcubacteria group bacterium]MCR4342314.1 class I SAM-dependent methyltransferase [Patescibacteria group bacterium]
MSKSKEFLSKYYGEKGDYLKDHDSFLTSASIKKDSDFLIKALSLKKNDTIFDIACGQGRHTKALSERGYLVDGVDFSKYLLSKAKDESKKSGKRTPNYYKANIEQLKLRKKYDKAYWFFSDLANINIEKAVSSIGRNIKPGGKILIDTDNLFRIVSYLEKNPNSPFAFDAKKLELIDKKANLRIPYPPYPVWSQWMEKSGFSVERVIGNYDFSEYSLTSPRLILIAKKITQ